MIKDIRSLLRPNIARLTPYSTARDDFKGRADIFLDANESAYDTGYNRYPDPRQVRLKQAIARAEGLDAGNLFLGNGSDEAIDILLRVFCTPQVHNAVAISPSYGMYEVAAEINDVELRKVSLESDFSLDIDRLLAATDTDTRLVFLCSPNNPTGNLIPVDDILRIADRIDGIVVVDEAYVHFSSQPSIAEKLPEYNNIVVLRTLSKAYGMAALRVGMAIASPEIIRVMSNVKYPYNLSDAAMDAVMEILEREGAVTVRARCAATVAERARVAERLAEMECVDRVYPSDANFLLVKVDDADRLYDYLAANGIIVRNRTRVDGCHNCLRITIGLREENDKLIETIAEYEKETADN